MRGSIFRSRAIEEGLRYGKDRWVFLRELAQNARDAGARKIRVRTGLEDGEVMVSFEDDGAGMGYEHARDYLFRLYASSKEGDQSNAGKFGVGFWSVLLFEPSLIIIESRPREGSAWAVALDGDLKELSHQPCSLDAPGTRVVLRRPTREPSDPAEVAHQVRAALSQYCRHLRRNDRDASPLPVEVDGINISEALSTSGTVQMRFRERNVEGVVGLGEKPKVELYSRGLLVWRGTLLDELRYGAREGDGRQFPPGLAPVYVLNGHRLNVTLDRRAVIDDRRLTEVRVVARRAMRNLLHGYLDKFSPRTPWQRLYDALVGMWEDEGEEGRRTWIVGLGIAAFLVVALIVALPNLVARSPSARLLSQIEQAEKGEPIGSSSAPLLWPQVFRGVGVEEGRGAFGLQLAYEPQRESHFFRVVGLDRLHAGLGMESVPLLPAAAAPAFVCQSGCLDVAVRVDAAAGPLPLPLPAGYSVVPSSVRLDGEPVGPLKITALGDPLLDSPKALRGTLTYRAGKGRFSLSPAAVAALLAIPEEMTLPTQLSNLAARAKVGWSPAPRARWLAGMIEALIAYDTSPDVARHFGAWLATHPRKGFLDFVMQLGRGDCDVKNVVLVATLRKAEVPARLALGYIGEAGQAQPGLHAWTETYLDGFFVLDASGTPAAAVDAAQLPALLPPPVEGDTGSQGTDSSASAAAAESGGSSAQPPAELGEAPAVPQSRAASPASIQEATRRSKTNLLRMVALVFGCLSALLALVAFALAVVGRRRLSIETALGAGSAEEIAARLLESAVFRPDLWANVSNLTRRELLPVRGRKIRMTLREAFARCEKGVLWRASEDSPLMLVAGRRGIPVLDGEHRVFGELVRRLPGCVDLDELSRLVPLDRAGCPERFASALRLVEQANELLEEAGVVPGLLRLCATGSAFPIRDVDLRRLCAAVSSQTPAVFVAVVADRLAVEQLVRLSQKSPKLAAYALVELAVVESALLRPLRPFLRVKAAVTLCERAGESP